MYNSKDEIILTGDQANEIQKLIADQQKLIESLRNEVELQSQKYVDTKWEVNELDISVKTLIKKNKTLAHEYNKSKETEKLMTRRYIQEKDAREFAELRLSTYTNKRETTKPAEKTVKRKPIYKRISFEEVYA